MRERVIVFHATFNNISDISWRSVLLVEETGVLGKTTNPQCHFKNTLALYHVYFRSIIMIKATTPTELVHFQNCNDMCMFISY